MNILRASIEKSEAEAIERATHLAMRLAKVGVYDGTLTREQFIEKVLGEIDDDLVEVLSGREYGVLTLIDAESGYVLKPYPPERTLEAALQHTTMNTLARLFEQKADGISAVRHPVLLTPTSDSEVAVGVVEPAVGHRNGEEFSRIDIGRERRTRALADTALGRLASATLVNDIANGNNVFETSLGDELGTNQLVIIDQPLCYTDSHYRLIADALRGLGAQVPAVV